MNMNYYCDICDKTNKYTLKKQSIKIYFTYTICKMVSNKTHY